MPTDDWMRVGEAARAVGVSVRTLHHWEQCGLIAPSERSDSQYRLYSPADIARIRRVKLHRDLGTELSDIRAILDAPAAERTAELIRRRAALAARIAELREVLDSVDRLLEANDRGLLLSEAEQRSAFGPGWDTERVPQAARRWGDTPQWAEYSERAAERSDEDWRAIVSRSTELDAELATAKRDGVEPGSPRADALAERHRAAMGEYFHCTVSMHILLGRMLASEAGYVEHYDGLEPGLARWLRDIIEANARAHGVDPDLATWE